MSSEKEEKKSLAELYIFPFMSRFPSVKGKIDLEAITQDELDKISYHYMKQLVKMLDHHGFQLDKKFYQDFELVHNAFTSSLQRTVGKYHPLQEYVDQQNEKKKTV